MVDGLSQGWRPGKRSEHTWDHDAGIPIWSATQTMALRAPTVNHDIGSFGKSVGVPTENFDTVRDMRWFDHRDEGVEPAYIERVRVADPEPHHQLGPVVSG